MIPGDARIPFDWIDRIAGKFPNFVAFAGPAGNSMTFADLATQIRRDEKLLEEQFPIEEMASIAGRIVILSTPRDASDFPAGTCFSAGAFAVIAALARSEAIVAPSFGADPGKMAELIGLPVDFIISVKPGPESNTEYNGVTVCTSTDPTIPGPLQILRARNTAGLLLATSGTTGKPKVVVHDLHTLAGAFRDRRRNPHRVVLFMPPDHIGGVDTIFRTLSSGGTVIIPESRTPDGICFAINAYGAEVLPASPSFLAQMILSGAHCRHDMSSLKIIGYGAEPMPEKLLERLGIIFPGVEFQQKFGTTETSAVRIKSTSGDSTWIRIDDPGAEWKVVKGELWLRTRTTMLGYLEAGEEDGGLAGDGWYPTGDLVELGEAGCFRIAGRISEVINVGGLKVLPLEVEEAILRTGLFSDALVRGESNPITGQIVTALVVSGGDCNKLDHRTTRDLLRKALSDQLPAYKIPVKVRSVASIDRGAGFKAPGRETSPSRS